MTTPRSFLAGIIVLAACLPVRVAAQDTVNTWVREHYTRRDVMIPMRDGARLFSTIWTPRDSSQRWPILLTRTPYATDRFLSVFGPGPTFGPEGFIIVYQDVRGRYQSEGEFVNIRPYLPDKMGTQVDEASDTWDTITWLLANVAGNNGRVAQYGVSYLGFYTTMGILSGHPALVAASPQAPVTDWFIGDDFHHNGAFFLMDGFGFMSGFGVPRPAPTTRHERGYDTGPDGYRFHLAAGALPNYNARLLRNGIPFWNEMMAHPTYDAWWAARSPLQYLRNVKPATMVVGGWYDHEDLWGTLAVYHAIEKQNPGARNTLVMGPWYHGQWWFEPGTGLGDVAFGQETSTFYHENIELPFYNCLLKDRCDKPLAEAWVFETGRNRWHGLDSWPPSGVTPTAFRLGSRGRLSPSASAAGTFAEYVSDPAHPVPYYGAAITRGYAREYMNADQRFAWSRPDVASWVTEPLESDVTIAGPIQARLSVSTTGTDADWIVKLIDVWPEDAPAPSPNPRGVVMAGYQEMVRAEVMRGKFRNSYAKPEPFVPGKATPVNFTLQDAFHTFRKGHRIMVQVQSSWFPLVDRNPQQFLNIYAAKDADFRKATQRIYDTSSIVLPVWRTP